MERESGSLTAVLVHFIVIQLVLELLQRKSGAGALILRPKFYGLTGAIHHFKTHFYHAQERTHGYYSDDFIQEQFSVKI